MNTDVAIVGAGAAGLATAIFAARRHPDWSLVALDGARQIGAKILVSGGGRCNVTNRRVTPGDFFGGNPNVLRRVFAAFPVEHTVAFFAELGVPLHEEEDGKLFPDTNRARSVVAALLDEAARRGVAIQTAQRVNAIERGADGFDVTVERRADASRAQHVLHARNVVLATGGLSLPKTGSDGAGYDLARKLGHTLVPTTPGLAPFVLDGDFHVGLSGVAQEVELTIRTAPLKPTRLRGPMLWTHFGVSGPVALNASRFWHRANLEQRAVTLTVNFLPGDDLAAAERRLLNLATDQPRTALRNALAGLLPARLADSLLAQLGIGGQIAMAQLARDHRRRLVHALLEWPLPVRDSRGYAFAEVTAGGVPLAEVDPATMGSRICPGLHLVGEILDVDGRIGGFNFQWAWSSAWVAAAGLV